ncbi:hypothetical protein [Streptomyces sp. NPDC054784]
MTRTQQYEIEAWLGHNHGLTAEQIGELAAVARRLDERYSDDQRAEKEAALTAAYRILAGDEEAVAEIASSLAAAREVHARAMAEAWVAAELLIPGHATESGLAKRFGLDRMTIRKWLGKR